MITVHETIQGSEEWAAARIGKFTGSNAYRLLGSFGANEYSKAIEASFSGNFYTKRGHILEEEAIEIYETVTGRPGTRPGYVTNSDYPSCLYSPDDLDDEYVIEVKCFGEKPHMQIFKGDIPLKVLAQIHFGMLICGKKKGRLVIYNPDLEPQFAFKIIEIPFSRDIQNNFKRILAAGETANV